MDTIGKPGRRQRVGEAEKGAEAGGREGRDERGEDGGSLVEFTHHITTANRNPQSIGDIFIIPVKFN